jgi:demethylmenaquinone methyltransferase/2-methoxy-6-polyprenyl-1,4-benzoquinol methylase
MRGAASSTWRPPRSSVQEPAASTLRTQSPDVGDVLGLLEGLGGFQLVFAGAQGGKVDRLGPNHRALRPGGLLVVDDMRPAAWIDEEHLRQTAKVRQTLLQHPSLTAVELQWASDVIIAAKRHA